MSDWKAIYRFIWEGNCRRFVPRVGRALSGSDLEGGDVDGAQDNGGVSFGECSFRRRCRRLWHSAITTRNLLSRRYRNPHQLLFEWITLDRHQYKLYLDGSTEGFEGLFPDGTLIINHAYPLFRGWIKDPPCSLISQEDDEAVS